MAKVFADRVLETSTSTGTGDMTLGAAVPGFKTFDSACTVGSTCDYAIYAVDANNIPTGAWETGLGTYSATNTLTRTTVQASSNGGAAVAFAAGSKLVQLGFNAASLAALIASAGSGGGGGGGTPLFYDTMSLDPNSDGDGDSAATMGVVLNCTTDRVVHGLIPSARWDSGGTWKAAIYHVDPTDGHFLDEVAEAPSFTSTYQYNGRRVFLFASPVTLHASNSYAFVIVRTDGSATTAALSEYHNGGPTSFMTPGLNVVGAVEWARNAVPSAGDVPALRTTNGVPFAVGCIVELGASGGGGGGASDVVAKAMIRWNADGTYTLAGKNISSITKLATGRYQATFTAAIPANCVMIGSGRFGDASSDQNMEVGVSRRTGEGVGTATCEFYTTYASTLYDPWNTAAPNTNAWTYIEIKDPTV